MDQTLITKPESSEYADYYARYVSLVGEKDVLEALVDQIIETQNLLAEVPEKKETYRYAVGKWSIREMIGHLIDTERIMAYRALRFARHDPTPLEGFEQDPYIENAGFDSCRLVDLTAEFKLIRAANLLMLENLPPEAWNRKGIASGNPVSVRALAYIIAGHELHHIGILRERYLAE